MKTLDYPLAPRSDVFDEYFGTRVSDPYRYLEDPADPRTVGWLAAQNRLKTAYFGGIARQYELVKRRLTSLWHYPKYSVLSKEGDHYFFWGLDVETQPQGQIQNQAVLYRQGSPGAAAIPVIDPNLIDPSGNSAILYQSFSRDGRLVAYTVSQDGSDKQNVLIRHTLDRYDYNEVIEGCKTVNIAWKADNSGFFYNRFIEPLAGANTPGKNCIFWHTLDTPQAQDTLVFAPETADPALAFYPETSFDGRYLVLYATRGTEPHNQILFRETDSTAAFRNLTAGTQNQFVFIGSSEETLYFQTTWHAPRGQIIAINLARPETRHWQVVVPEQTDSLAFVIHAKGKLVGGYLHSAYHCLKVFTLTGEFEGEIELPPFITVSGITGKPDSTEIFISLESFTSPPSVFSYDLESRVLTLMIKPALDFEPDQYETFQVFYPSEDGTMIPMFLTHRKGLTLNQANPTLLTGYGGFGISQTPIFLISQALWLDQGGVLAVANIRGGGELGLDWHEQGRLGRKQNSFTDFCAAAEWLIREKYTSPARLAIMGHSGGGLLAAGSAVQTPHLFGAVVCRAGLTDMLRYHRVGAGRNWLAEYGCSEANPAEFETLFAYSPLHNLRTAAYPATLVTVPLGDERVHPMHSFKFVAGLQANSTGDNPILLSAEPGGHGLGNAASRMVDELCEIYTFLFSLFEMI